MGNCLVLQEEKAKKMIRIMTVDGKILAYRSPLKVHQALSEFPGHALSASLPVVRHLDPEADMQSGNSYYLLPPKAPAAEANSEQGRGSTVRIKLVVSRKELKEMLMSKGGVSLGEMISQLQSRPGMAGGGDSVGSGGWKPVLASIPEVNDVC